MKPNDGGAAFPGPYLNEHDKLEVIWKQGGMSLRDYFAASAMQAIAHEVCRTGREFGYTAPDAIAKQAYEIADAMLAERNK